MLHSIGRYSGRIWTRPGRGIRYAGNKTLVRSFSKGIILGEPVTRQTLDLPQLDEKWRAIWQSRREQNRSQGEGTQDGKKMYILPMFPYPSGELHLGHLRVYTISDVLARFRRMQGYNVIHPIGWDAFGLPAENAAIERGIDPASWTFSNIERMKAQLEAMNGSWDWDREFATCSPTFYKHTQELFLLLHEHGLAYQAESLVNYDPVDKTVLANEQVDSNGFSWRSGAKVEKRLLKQWFFKISEFKEELLRDLDYLAKDGGWPERVLSMQKNWLGKSTGARVKFPVVAYDQQTHSDIEVFTTRPDTLFGVQYIALASTHSIVKQLAKTDIELQAFLDTLPALSQDSKVGYLLPNVRATNPLSYDKSTPDATKASLPIYVAPYVLGDYGDGAVMGVPGHDTRDHAFWKHNRSEDPIRVVISPSPDGSTVAHKNQPYVYHGHLTSHNGAYAGQSSAQASEKILEFLQSRNMGSPSESWRLRDWLISRQRYWGTPIPIVHCANCGAVPVPKEQLPVVLPSINSHWAKGKVGNPLDDAHDWVNTSCPKCQGPAKRDTDTMDTFVDSSWYFMRFLDPDNEDALFAPKIADEYLPVDVYIGGVEHAILHLLYARFISKFISTTGLWSSTHRGEPFKKVLTQGMVHGKTYSDPTNGRFLKPDEVDLSVPAAPKIVATGQSAKVSFEKMSKSKYNGVDPGECMMEYGADATRAHILFQAPVSEVLEWDEEKISGVTRWLKRIFDHIQPQQQLWWAITDEATKGDFTPKQFLLAAAEKVELWKNETKQVSGIVGASRELGIKAHDADVRLWRVVQTTIASVTEAYGDTFSLNTVVSDLMTLTNSIIEHETSKSVDKTISNWPQEQAHSPIIQKYALHALIQMMAPITPAFSEECWRMLHPSGSKFNFTLKPGGLMEKIYGMIFPGPPFVAMDNEGRVVQIPKGVTLVKWAESAIPSVFDFPFPESDGTLPMLSSDTQKCAVQINGKMKFVVEISIPPAGMAGQQLEKWIEGEILRTEEGKTKLKGNMDVNKAKKVIVVRGGKTVNFVI